MYWTNIVPIYLSFYDLNMDTLINHLYKKIEGLNKDINNATVEMEFPEGEYMENVFIETMMDRRDELTTDLINLKQLRYKYGH